MSTQLHLLRCGALARAAARAPAPHSRRPRLTLPRVQPTRARGTHVVRARSPGRARGGDFHRADVAVAVAVERVQPEAEVRRDAAARGVPDRPPEDDAVRNRFRLHAPERCFSLGRVARLTKTRRRRIVARRRRRRRRRCRRRRAPGFQESRRVRAARRLVLRPHNPPRVVHGAVRGISFP
eukprot:31128-Pelagococcus_subviridis.AAC.5